MATAKIENGLTHVFRCLAQYIKKSSYKKQAVNDAQWYLRHIIGQHNNRSLDNDCINYKIIFIISSIYLKCTSVYFAHIHLIITHRWHKFICSVVVSNVSIEHTVPQIKIQLNQHNFSRLFVILFLFLWPHYSTNIKLKRCGIKNRRYLIS